MRRYTFMPLMALLLTLPLSYCDFAQDGPIPNIPHQSNKIPFDAKVWRYETKIDGVEYPRLKMVEDLISKKILHGKKYKEIIALLGEPFSESFNEIHYTLGPDRNRSRSIADIYLVIYFDKSGMYNSYEYHSRD